MEHRLKGGHARCTLAPVTTGIIWPHIAKQTIFITSNLLPAEAFILEKMQQIFSWAHNFSAYFASQLVKLRKKPNKPPKPKKDNKLSPSNSPERMDAGFFCVLKQSSPFPLWEAALGDSHLPHPVRIRISEVKDLVLHFIVLRLNLYKNKVVKRYC